MTTLRRSYEEKRAARDFRPDSDQLRAVDALEELRICLENTVSDTLWGKLRRGLSGGKACRGYYFYGGVGRGKSMVMDLFFDTVNVSQKRRVHFHAFMLEVHDFLHKQRSEKVTQARIDGDLIACADDIARKSRLLCFDEFQVKDVADAMILGRLFTALFQRGVTVVATSNTAPDDLYADGLQRDRFIPFIALLKEKLDVIHFTGKTDYRLDKLLERDVYFCPDNAAAAMEMNKTFLLLANGTPPEAMDITVKGRVIHVPRAARDTAVFSFAELCEQPKSAVDYLELVKRFHIFLLENVPQMNDMKRDPALRFITLIDTLYDHKAQLVVSAAAPPEKIYTGSDHAHAFARTASRLMEMQSREYRAT